MSSTAGAWSVFVLYLWFPAHDDRRTGLIRKNSKSVQSAAHESGTKLLSEKSLLNTCKSNHFFEARYLWEHSTVCAQRVFTLGDSVNAEPAKTAGMHWRLGQTSVLEVKANVSRAGVLNCFEDNESQFASYSLTANRTNTASLEAVIGNVTSPDARYKERYFKMLFFFNFNFFFVQTARVALHAATDSNCKRERESWSHCMTRLRRF